MSQRVYATEVEFADYLTPATPPANASRMLREASRDVEQMTLTAVYETDVDGMPTDAEVLEAFMLATCMQAEYAKEIGDSYSIGASQFHSVSIGSASLTRGYGPGGSTTPGRYSRKAWECLQRAGLTGGEPWSR